MLWAFDKEFYGKKKNRLCDSLFFPRNEAGAMWRDISNYKGLGRDIGAACASRKTDRGGSIT